MEYEELKSAAQNLSKHFPESSNITRGNMLGSLDQWRGSQTFYINLATDNDVANQ